MRTNISIAKANIIRPLLTAALALALAFTFSCSSDGDDGGDEQSCGGSLDGVWKSDLGSITISGSTGVISALPPGRDNPMKVGDQVYRGLTSTGNLVWSGQEMIDTDGGISWSDVQLTMSADWQTLTIISLDTDLYGDTIALTRKCKDTQGLQNNAPNTQQGGSI